MAINELYVLILTRICGKFIHRFFLFASLNNFVSSFI